MVAMIPPLAAVIFETDVVAKFPEKPASQCSESLRSPVNLALYRLIPVEGTIPS